MHYKNLILADKNGASTTMEYAFADEGNVLKGKAGDIVSSIEKTKASDYVEIPFSDDEIDDAEAYNIIFGGDGA